MNKFKALLMKDFQVNKKTLIFPIWISVGFYALFIFSIVLAYIRGDYSMEFIRFEADFSNFEPNAALNYILNFFLITLPGLLGILITIMINQNALNEDIRKNYELFHRSQPVSIWKRTFSKFIIGTGGSWIIILLISFFNFIVINLILGYLNQFVFYAAFSGFIQGLIIYFKVYIVIGALAFFASALFKEKAFFTGLGILLAIQVFLWIINALMNWNIASPIALISDLVSYDKINELKSLLTEQPVGEVIASFWKHILFNIKTIYQIIFSGILFYLSTIIYSKKEVI